MDQPLARFCGLQHLNNGLTSPQVFSRSNLGPVRLPINFCQPLAPPGIGLSLDFYRSSLDLQVALVPGKTPDKMAVNRCSRRQTGTPHKVVGILPVCMGRFWFRPPRTSPLSGEHSRKPVQLCHLNIETDLVGMTIFADKGMGIPITMKVIENIPHYFCLDAVECELTPIMFVASEVNNLQHFMLL